jgi:hypothetical protein
MSRRTSAWVPQLIGAVFLVLGSGCALGADGPDASPLPWAGFDFGPKDAQADVEGSRESDASEPKPAPPAEVTDAQVDQVPEAAVEDAASAQPGDAAVEADAGQAIVDAGNPGTCGGDTTDCSGACVNLKTDEDHCGACGHACPGGRDCDGQGQCTAPDNCRYASFGGHDYFFCTNGRSWSQARSACLNWGLDLAIVDNDAENTFAKAAVNQWIGLNDLDDEDNFRWVKPGDSGERSGAAPSFAPWGNDEPNNTQDCTIPVVLCATEDCGELRSDGTWNDGQCSESKAYVCESY